MCRHGDVGPYSKDNVSIKPHECNSHEANVGKVLSASTRAKISESARGNKWCVGKKNGLGHKVSPEHRAKMNVARWPQHASKWTLNA